MRVLVCGSRDWGDGGIIEASLCGQCYPDDDAFVVIHGAARGADSIAGKIANAYGWQVEAFPADWDKHGKAAGHIRNQQMLDEGRPDLVLAFVSKPLEESRGTANMVKRAKAASVPTYVISRA